MEVLISNLQNEVNLKTEILRHSDHMLTGSRWLVTVVTKHVQTARWTLTGSNRWPL